MTLRSRLPLIALALVSACRVPDELPPRVAQGMVSTGPASSPLRIVAEPDAAKTIALDVAVLASPEFAGRGTGEEGSRAAAQWLAKRFETERLLPFGDADGSGRSYLQRFDVRVGATAGPATLSFARGRNEHAVAAADFVTAEGSASGSVRGEAVFVGDGVTAPALGWDDYAGLDAKGKITILLDGLSGARVNSEPLRAFGSLRFKIRTAREHGALGVVVLRRGELSALPSDATSMGLPAVVARVDAMKAAWPLGIPKNPTVLRGVSVALETRMTPVTAEALNVVGLLPADPASAHAHEFVVVGAHYDHLGHGGTSASRAPGVRAVHPGADDNASGTALVLEVLRRMAELPRRPSRGVLFVLFGAEELGVLGSRHFVDHPPVALGSISAMINADMVGRMRENRLLVDGLGTSDGWRAMVERAADGLSLSIAQGDDGFGASDHTSFTAARVPVAFLFTGVHDDYHLPSDTADKIDAGGVERAATLAARLCLEVTERPDRLAFVDAPLDPHRGGVSGFRVALGTIPDYAYSGVGVRLTGVRVGAPADSAGLRAGDVIVKVGAHVITNIHDYTYAIGELEPGARVTIEVVRGEAHVALEAVPSPGR
jgi:hypothetical protein